MKKIKSLFVSLFLFAAICSAQSYSGLAVGIQYESTTHTNPYVYVNGTNAYSPESVVGYSDKTSFLYFPFGYYYYGKDGYGELSTYSWHLLLVGIINLINPNKQYEFSTDKVYRGDSYADGYVPVFQNANNAYKSTNPAQGLEASFNDMDWFRLAFAGSYEELTGLPITLGFQGGVSNFGVHFSKVQEEHEPTPINQDYTGLVNFNDAVNLYFGVSVGYITKIIGHDLAVFNVQYDWNYFAKDVDAWKDESKLQGNKITVELTYFPWDHRSKYLRDIHFKAFVKTVKVPYMKIFSKSIPTEYSFTKIGLGINYFIL